MDYEVVLWMERLAQCRSLKLFGNVLRSKHSCMFPLNTIVHLQGSYYAVLITDECVTRLKCKDPGKDERIVGLSHNWHQSYDNPRRT
jgi:hypothetical protein